MRTIRDLLRLAGVTPGQILRAVLAGSITLLSALTLTVLSGWLITRAWQMPPVLELGVAITAVRALGISRAVFRYLDRLTSHKIALAALTRLRARLFDAIATDPTGRTTTRLGTRGEGMNRLASDTDRVTDLIVRTIIPVGVAIVLSVIAVGFAALLHPVAPVLLAVGFLLTGVLSPWLATRASRRGRHVESEDELNVLIDEALAHRAEFEAAGQGEAHAEETRAASARHSAASVEAERPEAVGQGIHAWATGLTAATVLILAMLTYQGDPTWLGMLIMLPLAAFEAHGELAKAAVHADEAQLAARRLVDLAGGTDIPTPPDTHPAPLADVHLRAQNLATVYGEATWDLDLPPGGRMLIRGPSGCGKTSLLLTVAGLLPPDSGSVSIGGQAVSEIDEGVLRATVRVHTEDEWVFATTVRENLRVANPSADDELLHEVLGAVGLSEWVEGLGGLDTLLADGAGSLSSGQRRRLLLARALCSTAPVLLLDEPTEHVDAASSAAILDTLMHGSLPGARADRSVIVVTHVGVDEDAGQGLSVEYATA